MLNLNSILIGSSQPQVLAKFYEKVFNKPSEMPQMDDQDNNGWYGWLVGNTFLSIGPHSEVQGTAKEPQRIMLNLETNEVQQEYQRLVGLGANSVREPYQIDDSWIATLADPDGNYFQLVTPWNG